MEKFEQNIDQKKYLKELRWESTMREAGIIIDGIGKSIDPNIKETVVGLMVNEYKTTGSCEGHLDRGLPHPWIDLEMSLTDIEKTELEELRNRLVDAQDVKKEADSSDIALWDKFEEKKKLLKDSVSSLLKDFYTHHKPKKDDVELFPLKFGGGFRIQPKGGRGLGKKKWVEFDTYQKSLTQVQIEDNLKAYREEMQDFAQFLKDKFFKQ